LKCDILLTNDDGYRSIGLRVLLKELKALGNVVTVVPEQPKSAAGLSITLHRPLRIKKILIDDTDTFLVNGTTGDCVTIALYYILSDFPKIVCSGINMGENISLVEFFMSGTVAGAIVAALNGIPAIAFSKRMISINNSLTSKIKLEFKKSAKVAKEIVRIILKFGFPREIDLLNVNFPQSITKDTKVVLTRLARSSFKPAVIVRSDPRGRPYYWLWGEKITEYTEGTDGYAIFNSNAISITPICLSHLSYSIVSLQEIVEKVQELISREIKD